MKKTFQIGILYFLIFFTSLNVFSQEKLFVDVDLAIKEKLYSKYRDEVLAFNRRDFDNLFLEFFDKQNSQTITLSKEEFYNYTIKIAIYSEKLGLLYKSKKEESQQAKKEWFNKSYSDYLIPKSNILKKILALLMLYLFQSCNYFEKQIPKENELLKEKLNEINWKEVDEYPSISDCEKLDNSATRKQCFFEFITNTIQQKLSVDTLKILFPRLDTIEVKVTVNPDATIVFEPQFPKDSVAYDTIKIDSILKSRLVDFPKINPAIKRGIPVKTLFVLPVVIKTEK